MRTIKTIVPLLLCMVITLQAQEYDRVVKKSFSTSSSVKVEIDTKFGPVRVTPASGNTVTVVVGIIAGNSTDAEAKKIAEATRVEIDGSSKKVTIRTAPPKNYDEDDHGVSIDVIVTMPRGGNVELETKFGNVYVEGISGRTIADSKFGAVEIKNCANVKARNSFGDLRLGGITGKLEVEGKMGQIIAHKIEGGVIRSSYGDVEISQVSGFLDISSSMGTISINGIRNGEVSSSYGSVEIVLDKKFAGRIKANSSFGSIDSDYELKDAGKKGPGSMGEQKYGVIGKGSDKIVIESRFGSITLE